jgi:geranylgeranyl pyrophosphate synthase
MAPLPRQSAKAGQEARKLEDIYAPIAKDLALNEEQIRKALGSGNDTVAEMVAHLTQNMGKRVRSALVLLCNQACRAGKPQDARSREQAMMLAEAMELIHYATLIHDDIIDNSPLRRGVKTLNYAWGNELSVLMGDLLFARVFARLAAHVDSPIIVRVAQATDELCDGEIQEVRTRYLVTLSESQYYDTIYKKTASLIAASCEVGGMAAGAGEDTLRALGAYGAKVGLAFQIADDLLDLEADEATLGKPQGHDLLEGKMTLPVILALARATSTERAVIQELLLEDPLQPAQLQRAVEFIRAQGGIALARAQALRLVDEARGALAALPESPARRSLEDLAGYFVARKH